MKTIKKANYYKYYKYLDKDQRKKEYFEKLLKEEYEKNSLRRQWERHILYDSENSPYYKIVSQKVYFFFDLAMNLMKNDIMDYIRGAKLSDNFEEEIDKHKDDLELDEKLLHICNKIKSKDIELRQRMIQMYKKVRESSADPETKKIYEEYENREDKDYVKHILPSGIIDHIASIKTDQSNYNEFYNELSYLYDNLNSFNEDMKPKKY